MVAGGFRVGSAQNAATRPRSLSFLSVLKSSRDVRSASGRRMRQTIAAARLGFPLEIDAGQRLPIGVADDEVPHPDVALAYATPS
jgi:hypothetical protein